MRFVSPLLLVLALAFAPLAQAAQETAQAAAQPALFVENTSGKSFYDTLKALDDAVKAARWSIIASHRMHENMAEKGHKIGRVTILELCNIQHALAILKHDQRKYVSSMMPCRVSVYETQDGRVIVSRINAQAFAGMLAGSDPELARTMGEAGADIEKIIAQALAK